MKDNIPIIINNRDRLNTTKDLVLSLLKRDYSNIVILDNGSTYKPLLDWYNSIDVTVFHNTFVEHNLYSLNNLIYDAKHPFFTNLIQDNWYVYTDSDINLIEETPNNFIEDLIDISKKYNKTKTGLGILVSDIKKENYTNNEYWELIKYMKEYEEQFWSKEISDVDDICKLYDAPIDTTFAVYKPNSFALLTYDSLRTGFPYILRHLPFYYDLLTYPDDELYYLQHKSNNAITGFSDKLMKFFK